MVRLTPLRGQRPLGVFVHKPACFDGSDRRKTNDQVTEGDRVRIVVTNRLPESTTVHWHGLVVPNGMDGPAEITQEPIEPGESYTYEYTVRDPGTFMYHTHDHPDRQQALGLYGALIVKPKDEARDRRLGYQHDVVIQLQEWLEREVGLTRFR